VRCSRTSIVTTNLMFLILGMALFSSTVLMPQLLQTLMDIRHKGKGWCFRRCPVVLLAADGRQTHDPLPSAPCHGLAGHVSAGMYISCKQVDLLMSFRAATLLRVWQYLHSLLCPPYAAGYVACRQKKPTLPPAHEFHANIGRASDIRRHDPHCSTHQYHQSVLAEYTASGRFKPLSRLLQCD